MRIAHISDLHLRHALRGSSENPARLCREMPRALSAAVSLVNEMAPDLLAVTGDLVDYPQDKLDDPATRQRGLRDYDLIAEQLEQVACPVTLLPGNHDHPALMRQVFGPIAADRSIGGARVVSFPEDAEDCDHVPHRTGAVWDRMLRVCADEAAQLRVLLQHYIVWPDANEGYPHTYLDAVDMRDALSGSSGNVLSLSGHLHAGVPLTQYDGVWYAAVPAFCVSPHPVWLYDMDGLSVVCAEYLVKW